MTQGISSAHSGLHTQEHPHPHHHGQHVRGHRTGGPGHIHPAQQFQGTRQPPPRSRLPRPGTAPTKTSTPAHSGGQMDAGARGGKKAHQRALALITFHPTAHLPKELGHGAPHRPGGAGPPHHHRRPIPPRRPGTPLGPHSHPSDVPTTARPQQSRHPLPDPSTSKPQSHPTPPPLQDRTSHRIVGHPGQPPPNNPSFTSSRQTPPGRSSTGHMESSWRPRPTPRR